jgi:glutamine synthetase
VSAADLIALVCCDLGAIVRGRSLPAAELDEQLQAGVSWVPANHSLTPLGPLAEPNPFGSTGDLRLLPDPATRARVEAHPHWSASEPDRGDAHAGGTPLELVLCDLVETDGQPWECCPRRFLRAALEELEGKLGLRVLASFEHEFQLLSDTPPALPFSLEAQRRAEPFATDVMVALAQAGVQPERFLAEYAAHQFEIPAQATVGMAVADRSVVLKEVVRELARRHGLRASFAPLTDPAGPGNGVYIRLSLIDTDGRPVLYDAARPACLSELGERFAAGILLHAGALSALSAPSPVSAARLAPHHWSAGAVCLAQRNREALLRIPPLVSLGGGQPASQLRLEYRGADAAANPYLALGGIVRAGLDGVRAELPAPPILDRDPGTLDSAQARRYGVGALPASLTDALRALAADDTARGWMPSLLYDAYVGVKRAELETVADLDIGEVCRRYATVY